MNVEENLEQNPGGRDYHGMVREEFRRLAPVYDRFAWFVRGMRGRVAKAVPLPEGARVLDVCTGTGEQALAFSRRGAEVEGIDLSPDMLAVARGKDREGRVAWREGDARSLPHPDDAFDLTTVSLALHDMPASLRTAVLGEMRRTTRPGGRVVVVDYGFTGNSLRERFFRWFFGRFELDYYHDFLREDLVALVERAGLEVVGERRSHLGAFRILICDPGKPGEPAAAGGPQPAFASASPREPRRENQDETYIRHLFDSIARHYDLMNLVMSAGALRYWQRVFRSATGLRPGDAALDVACGTGELSLIMARQVGPAGRVAGVDLSPGMVEIGRRKVRKAGLEDRVVLETGNALSLPFADDGFDCVATSFAMRNVSDVRRAFREMARVARPGGRVICLELSHPDHPIVRVPYEWYFYRVVPWLGRWNERRFRAGDRSRGRPSPYRWLPESLRSFPDAEGLAAIFREVGLERVRYRKMTGGIVCLHVGFKPERPDRSPAGR